MMAGNPNWWSMHLPQPPQYVVGSSSNIPLINSFTGNLNPPEPPQSWSQLLFNGLPGEEERQGFSYFESKKLENWDYDQMLNPSSRVPMINDVMKQEVSQSGNLLYSHGHEKFLQVSGRPAAGSSSWSHMVQVSSPSSCVTSFSSNNNNNNNILDFTYNKADYRKNQLPVQTSHECNSIANNIGVCKKARVQASSSQPPLKVRKEKLGDRITSLHQLVSPFGKTDTASVLLEAIGYIRFLQGQIEALTSPYLDSASKHMRNQVHGERNSVFPEDPGQLLNDNGLKKKGAPNQDEEDKPKDLRSRGLCLVPVSCTQHVGNELNGADYWAPAFGNGF